MKRLFLVDGTALVFRSFHAFSGRAQLTSRGRNVGMVYGFLSSLLSILRREKPDLLVLSVAVTPDPDAPRIAEMLGIPLTEDGFFLEAQMKLRPFEAPAEGVFICGLAHSPKLIEESIAQDIQIVASGEEFGKADHIGFPVDMIQKVKSGRYVLCFIAYHTLHLDQCHSQLFLGQSLVSFLVLQNQDLKPVLFSPQETIDHDISSEEHEDG